MDTSRIEVTSDLSRQFLPETETFLRDKSAKLKENKYSEDDLTDEQCARIAIEVAKIITSEGGSPQVLKVTNEILDSSGFPKKLTPVRYSRFGLQWIDHTVCENGGFVYDILQGKPVTLSEYLTSTFTDPAKSRVDLNKNEVRQFLIGNKLI